MGERSCLAIVLAAGEGTRMRSARAKVLHEVGGRSLVAHVLDAVRAAGSTATAVVIGPDAEAVAAEAKRVLPGADIYVQSERRGTAHAVLAARPAIARRTDDILVIYGDTPLIRPETLSRMRAALAEGAALAVLGFRPRDPSGYGRLVLDKGELVAIREEPDASADERAIDLCNGGLMAFAGASALAILDKIGNNNRKSEFYLTDAVEIARSMKLKAAVIETEEDDVRGINTKAQLAEAEAVLQQRLRKAAMDAGVTLIAPETVFLSADTKFGRDVVVEPFVVFGPGVTVDDNAVIRSFCHLIQCSDRQGRLGRSVRAAAAGRSARRQCAHRQLRRDQSIGDRRGRQGQPSRLYRRYAARCRLELRRRRDRVQLRRHRQAPHRHRQRRLYRLQLVACRTR